MGLQDGPDGFDTGLNRKASLPKKDDPSVRQLLSVDEFAEVLVGGQQNGAVCLSEGKNLIVCRSASFLRYRNDLVSREA